MLSKFGARVVLARASRATFKSSAPIPACANIVAVLNKSLLEVPRPTDSLVIVSVRSLNSPIDLPVT